MSADTDPILKKRQAALATLRRRRGEARQQAFASRVDQEKDRLSLILKTYKSLSGNQISDPEDEEGEESLLPPSDDAPDLPGGAPPDVPLIGDDQVSPVADPKDLARVVKVRGEVSRRDERAQAAIKKWRDLMRNRRERQMAVGDTPPPAHPMPPDERRQMFFDLLTVDFLENSRIWISADPNSLDLSSTSRSEIEKLHENALYRRRVIEELGKMNEQEIDALTTYLRTVAPEESPAA